MVNYSLRLLVTALAESTHLEQREGSMSHVSESFDSFFPSLLLFPTSFLFFRAFSFECTLCIPSDS